MNQKLNKKIYSNLLRLIKSPINYLRELESLEAYNAISIITDLHSDVIPSAKRLLIDGHFLNPGYFYRLQIFRAAVGSRFGEEHAFIWRYKMAECQRALGALGIQNIQLYFPEPDPRFRSQAKRLFQSIRSVRDLLNLAFPYEVPASFLYDDILKRQRLASVNLDDPMVEYHIWEFLSSIHAAANLLEKVNPDLVAMSHSVLMQCAPISWLAAKKKIPVVTLFGNYGLPRFWRIDKPEDIYYGMDRPGSSDLDLLSLSRADELRSIGEQYLEKRFSGQTNDIGGRMAFADSGSYASKLPPAKAKPIIAVYASNWFDFPHALGMDYFDDFLDWIKLTLQAAIDNPSVQWIFRAHPCDRWYGGITLQDLIPGMLPSHVKLLSDDISGSDIMNIADALVTYHGTAGIEFASLGKPVLVSDRGWYHDCGFAVFPKSREHYLKLLGEDWYKQVDTLSIKERAKIFAGWYFCCPSWQAEFTLPDDSDRRNQVRLLKGDFLSSSNQAIGMEVALVREWLKSGTRGYHTFKMAKADAYALSNVIN